MKILIRKVSNSQQFLLTKLQVIDMSMKVAMDQSQAIWQVIKHRKIPWSCTWAVLDITIRLIMAINMIQVMDLSYSKISQLSPLTINEVENYLLGLPDTHNIMAFINRMQLPWEEETLTFSNSPISKITRITPILPLRQSSTRTTCTSNPILNLPTHRHLQILPKSQI